VREERRVTVIVVASHKRDTDKREREAARMS
jgi:hypothetical protein